MNPKSKLISAVDIGSSKITTLVAQVTTDPATLESSVSIVGVSSVASKGVKKGQIVNIEESVDTTINSVEAAERMAGYQLSDAYISVGGGHIESLNSTGVVAVSDPHGEISPEDVDRVVDAAKAISLPTSREIIHVIPRQFIVDGESGIKDPVGMSGVRLEVETHLVTASSAALKNLTKSVNEVGINIHELVFSGLASSFAVLSDTEKELGCVLIDIGGGTTSIAAFVDGALAYSATLPIGAKNVTNDLAIGLRVQLEPAETIKLALSQPRSKDEAKVDTIDIMDLGAGESKKVSRRTLIEGIIRPRLNEIFTMVRLDLEKKGLINRIPSGAIITGGGALTVAVEESAKRMLALPVRIGVPTGVTGLIDDIMTPAYAAGIGLILYGAQRGVFVQPQSSLSNSFKKIKLPTKGIFGKLTETIKDLLP
jgi:cell division protein FtsA